MGGVPTEAGLVDGGVDQGPWLQERVGGGVGTMAVPKKGDGWLFQRSQRVSYFCQKWLFLKDALWGGGGTHRSWPGKEEQVQGRIFVVSHAEKWFFLKDAL